MHDIHFTSALDRAVYLMLSALGSESGKNLVIKFVKCQEFSIFYLRCIQTKGLSLV